jgi:biopolymer transport protein ExbD
MTIKKRQKIKPYIPSASMSDIAFLLIVFFMVTTVVTTDRTKVDLPSSLERKEAPKDAAIVVVTKDGLCKATAGEEMSKPIAMEDIQAFAANVMLQNPTQVVILKADKEAKYALVDQALTQLKDAYVKQIYLLSSKEATQ